MTRGEIIKAWSTFYAQARERYWKAGCAIDASRDAPLALAAWVRRVTLEEAARAVCVDCAAGRKIHPNNPDLETHWFHMDEDGDSFACHAASIHDLIDALDQESVGAKS